MIKKVISYKQSPYMSHLKVGPSTSAKVFFIRFNESSIKTMKNAFCFMLKTLFILEIFTFLSSLFD